LDWGWKAVVVERRMLRREHRLCQRELVNCAPLSEVITAGRPWRAIQPANRANAQSAAVVQERGTASDHRVVRSTMVKRWV
jgi:hypothetical protein